MTLSGGKPISGQDPIVGPLDGTEELPVIVPGAPAPQRNRRVTTQQIADLAPAAPGLPALTPIVGPLVGDEIIPIDLGGDNFSATAQQIADLSPPPPDPELETVSITLNAANGATVTGTITDLPLLFCIVAMASTKAAWFRMYGTSAAAAADASRLRSAAPVRNTGVIADPVFTSAQTIWWDPPETYGSQATPRARSYPVRLTNDGTSGDVTITIFYLKQEP